MDPADNSGNLSHLCSAALDLLKRFDKLLNNNKHKPEGNTGGGSGNAPRTAVGHSCEALRSQQPQPQQQYSCKGMGDAAAAAVVPTCQRCDSVMAGSALVTSGAKRQLHRRVEKKPPALFQEKSKSPGPPPSSPPPPMFSLAAATTNDRNEVAPENSNNAASSSWQLIRLQPTELRLILKLDTWMTSDGSLVVRPSVFEDRVAAISTAGSKTEEMAAQRFSASSAGKQLMQPFKGPAASAKVAGNHRLGDTDETDGGRTIVIPLCRQQLLQSKQLQFQPQQQQQLQQQQQQLQQLQLQQHLQLQQLIEAQQQQQPQVLHQRQSRVPLPANLIAGHSLRNVSNNLNGTTLPGKTIFLPVSTSSATRRCGGGGGLQATGAALLKRRSAADSFPPQETAPCLCGAAADDNFCQVNNHHDNSNSESDNLSDQSDAINNSFGSDYSSRK